MKMNLIECPFCGSRTYSFKERAACSVCEYKWNIKNIEGGVMKQFMEQQEVTIPEETIPEETAEKVTPVVSEAPALFIQVFDNAMAETLLT